MIEKCIEKGKEKGKEKIAGKFGSAEELVKSYKELESAFTKKSQEVSALKAQIEEALSGGGRAEGQSPNGGRAEGRSPNGGRAEGRLPIAADNAQGEVIVLIEEEPVPIDNVKMQEPTPADNIAGQEPTPADNIAEPYLAAAIEEPVADDLVTSDNDGEVIATVMSGVENNTVNTNVEDAADIESVENTAVMGGVEDAAVNGAEATNNDTATSESSPAEYQQDIERFFNDNASAVDYAEQIGERVKGAPDYFALLQAYNEVLSAEISRLSQPPSVQALLELAGNNAEVTEGILGRYIEGLRSDKPPVTIKGGYGLVAVTPPKRPKNLSDAAGLAKNLLEKH